MTLSYGDNISLKYNKRIKTRCTYPSTITMAATTTTNSIRKDIKKITIREGLKVNVVFGFLNGPI
jgi:hypothetical protein